MIAGQFLTDPSFKNRPAHFVCFVFLGSMTIKVRCAVFGKEGVFMAVLDGRNYTAPTEKEMSLAEESSKQLARCLNRGTSDDFSQQITILAGGQHCESVVVPKAALRLFIDLLGQMAQGNIVTLFPIHAELTTQEAADLINVSRPFLVKQLETGELPFTRLGKHRRVKFQDLMDYKRRIDGLRDQALDELAALDQELNLGCD
jgi:excisionase family DNA binding protein